MAKVAFLGLGVMGYPMAGHLKTKGGHEVTVYNRTAAKSDSWVGRHWGRRAATPKEAAAGQDFVMACVGNDDDLRAVTLGADGAFAGMKNGAVFVDHTTASAEIARGLFAEAKKRGVIARRSRARAAV
jgi:3-hydroxyisobutyrate dehydrogenase